MLATMADLSFFMTCASFINSSVSMDSSLMVLIATVCQATSLHQSPSLRISLHRLAVPSAAHLLVVRAEVDLPKVAAAQHVAQDNVGALELPLLVQVHANDDRLGVRLWRERGR